jgi:hypothetical protein
MSKCIACGQAFKITGDKSGRCKGCKRAYGRQHYNDNKASYIARANANKQRYKLANLVKLHQYLLNHPCVDCGESEPIVLEFDHVKIKLREVGNLVKDGHSWDRIEREIENCEVRCANCHRKVTAQRAGWLRLRLMGGSALIYQWTPATKTA